MSDRRPQRSPRPATTADPGRATGSPTSAPPRTRSSTRRTTATSASSWTASPGVLPTLHVRIGDTLYLHGSTGSRPLLAARGRRAAGLRHRDPPRRAGAGPLAVPPQRQLPLGRRARPRPPGHRRGGEAAGAHRAGGEGRPRPGRATAGRPPARELAETAVLALPLREVSVKARVGGVNDDEADLALPHWAGVVPLRLSARPARAGRRVTRAVPDYLRPARSPWLTAPTLRGEHVHPRTAGSVACGRSVRRDRRRRGVPVADPTACRPTAGRDGRPGPRGAAACSAQGIRVPWVQRSRTPAR